MMEPWEQDTIAGESVNADAQWEQDEPQELPVSASEYASAGASGIYSGLAEIAGAPVDLANLAISPLGLSTDEPVGGSAQLKRLATDAGLIHDVPATTIGRGIERVGKEVGATIVPSGLLFRAAKGVAPISTATQSLFKQVLQKGILDPVRRAPGTAALGEAAATVGSGIGAATAREVAPGDPGAETTGQLVGGVVPTVVAVSPTALAIRFAKHITGKFSSKAQTAASKRVVEDLLGEELSVAAKANIQDAERVAGKIKGLKPSIAEATGSPALIVQQRQLETNAKGIALNKFVARHKANEAAIDTFVGKQAPQSDVDIEYVVSAGQNRVNTIGEKISALEARNLSEQERVALKLPEVDRMAEGTMMRSALVQRRSEVSAKMSIRAEELGINSANMDVQYGPWRKQIMEKYKPGSRFADPDRPAIWRQILKDDPKAPTTFQDIKSLRERITDDLIDSVGAANPNRSKVKFLASLKKDVDELVESLGDIGPKYKQFRTEYFDGYIKPFEQGAIFKIKDKNAQGFYKTTPEKIADSFLSNESSARQFQELFGSDAEMVESLKKSLLDDMRQSTVRDGVVNEKLFDKWVKGKRKVLKEIPELESVVFSHEKAQGALFARQSQLGKRRLAIERNAIAKRLTRYEGGVDGADKIFDNALKVPQNMRSLMSHIKGDAEATQGLKKILWDRATSGDSKATLNFLRDNQKSLRLAFGKEHLDDLSDISLAKAMIETVPTPTGTSHVPKPLAQVEEIIGQGIPQISSRVFAWKSGRMQKGYLFLDTFMRGLRGRAAVSTEKMLSEALYDPNVAREFADSFRGTVFDEKKARSLHTRLFALGLPYTEDEPNSDTK